MSSSMRLLNDPISKHGLVVIPKQQITGIGKNILFLIIMCKLYGLILFKYILTNISCYLFCKKLKLSTLSFI